VTPHWGWHAIFLPLGAYPMASGEPSRAAQIVRRVANLPPAPEGASGCQWCGGETIPAGHGGAIRHATDCLWIEAQRWVRDVDRKGE